MKRIESFIFVSIRARQYVGLNVLTSSSLIYNSKRSNSGSNHCVSTLMLLPIPHPSDGDNLADIVFPTGSWLDRIEVHPFVGCSGSCIRQLLEIEFVMLSRGLPEHRHFQLFDGFLRNFSSLLESSGNFDRLLSGANGGEMFSWKRICRSLGRSFGDSQVKDLR